MSDWSLYMIRDGHGCLYTGISTDVTRRLTEHASGMGARALRGKGPLELVFQQPVGGPQSGAAAGVPAQALAEMAQGSPAARRMSSA